MNCLRCVFSDKHILRVMVLLAMTAFASAQNPSSPRPHRGAVGSQGPLPTHEIFAPEMIVSGGALFQQNCAFCHGKDAGGGESGPDLTRSKLVSSDMKGEAIGNVVR